MLWHLSYQLNLWDAHFICYFCCYFTITCRGGKFRHHVWTPSRLSLNEYLQNKFHFFQVFSDDVSYLGHGEKVPSNVQKMGRFRSSRHLLSVQTFCGIQWLLANSKGPDQTAWMCLSCSHMPKNICMAWPVYHLNHPFEASELFVLTALDREVLGSNPAGGRIQLMTVKAQGLS